MSRKIHASPIAEIVAWGAFDASGTKIAGTGVTLTRTGNGQYDVTLSPAMPDANYVPKIVVSNPAGSAVETEVAWLAGNGVTGNAAPTASGFRFFVHNSNGGTGYDPEFIRVEITRGR